MWQVVLKDVPKYLVIGKGYSFDAVEMDLTSQAIRMGLLNNYEESMLAGDYHSGPLTVIIPFGFLGMVGFLWILIAGGRILYLNFRYGDARSRQANCVLLSFYMAYSVSFICVYGQLYDQLFAFLGTVGLSVSLNGGVKRKGRPVFEEIRAAQPGAVAIEVD
jgi:hypothetical protein